MAKTRQQKEEAVKILTDSIKNAKSVVFANFQGLKVSESDELRKTCREQNIGILASKKTLVKKAMSDAGMEADVMLFDGSVATFFGLEDEVAPAQIVSKFAKKHNVIKFFGGVLEGKFIDADKVLELSKLPGKQELYARLVGTINAPVSGFVNVLAGNIRNLVSVLNNIKEAKA